MSKDDDDPGAAAASPALPPGAVSVLCPAGGSPDTCVEEMN